MSEDRVRHVSLWDRRRPPAPWGSILADLWWCEGECPEDGEFWLVRAPDEASALATAKADAYRMTGEVPDEASMSVAPASASLVIAWWRRVQYPCLDTDPESEGDDTDKVGACPCCGRLPSPRGVDEDGEARGACCLWRRAWAAADCDGDVESEGVPLRPVTP